jgi:putative ABC transport system permease protein
LALLLAAVGIYGVISYMVSQRTREIGVRMALGAQQGDVLRIVVRHVFFIVGTGIALGTGGALALTQLLRSSLFQIAPTDATTYLVVGVVFVAVSLAACYIPARRAMRVDPLVALRYE